MNIPNGQRKKHHLEITSSKITFTSHHQTQTHTHTFNRKATPFSHVPGLAPRTWAVQGPMNLMGLRPSPLTVGKRAVLECPRWFAKVAPSVECVFLAPSVLSKRCCCCVKSECAYFGANLLHTHTQAHPHNLYTASNSSFTVGPEQCFMGLFWCDSASDLRTFWTRVAIMKPKFEVFLPGMCSVSLIDAVSKL